MFHKYFILAFIGLIQVLVINGSTPRSRFNSGRFHRPPSVAHKCCHFQSVYEDSSGGCRIAKLGSEFPVETWDSPKNIKIFGSNKTAILSDLIERGVTSGMFLLKESRPRCNVGERYRVNLLSNQDKLEIIEVSGAIIHKNNRYKREEYCFDYLDSEKISIILCQAKCNNSTHPCVPVNKCCKQGQILESTKSLQCKPFPIFWDPNLRHLKNARPIFQEMSTQNKKLLSYGTVYTRERFIILKDGRVILKLRKNGVVVSSGFCLDAVNVIRGEDGRLVKFDGQSQEHNVLIKFQPRSTNPDPPEGKDKEESIPRKTESKGHQNRFLFFHLCLFYLIALLFEFS